MLGSNQRPPPCRGGALPAELIALGGVNVASRLAAMRWRSALALSAAAALVPAAVATAGGTGAGVRVTPKVGTPKTKFVVTFRAPDRTGRRNGLQANYVLSVSGQARHCGSGMSETLPPTRKGAHVRVVLDPPAGIWCATRYAGRVEEWLRPVCGPAHPVCAQFIAVKPVGTFSFRVRDVTPPRFAGLRRATDCTPVIRPHERVRVYLSWNAAADDVTPSSQIVYEIYMSARPGREDFSRPNWSVRGATHFDTPSVPLGEFFVVRARDQAGNTDHNRIERQAMSPCV